MFETQTGVSQNFAILRDSPEETPRAETVDASTVEDAIKETRTDDVFAVAEIVFDNSKPDGYDAYGNFGKAYEAIMRLDSMSDDCPVKDLVCYIVVRAFEAGMKYQNQRLAQGAVDFPAAKE
ncbi:MAG: hypothetical protein EXS59_01755 [Candidatus Taylorbacteria bacterium]|nr:hypothetical protein [Candidatus Taylorbacteria bacterium]